MDDSISTSASSVRTLHQPSNDSHQGQAEREQHSSGASGSSQRTEEEIDGHNVYGFQGSRHQTFSIHTTTHSLVLPSPPDSPGLSRSPSIDSVSESSFPSVSSSFFFSSSAAASPGRSHPSSYPSSHPHSDHEQDEGGGRQHSRTNEHGLIIPSLSLPDALRRPTPFGQTLGQLKILVLGGQGAGKSFLTGLLLEDNEDVVDVGTWEDWHGGEEGAFGKVLKASTDWMEQRDAFGLERYEATKNVEIVELPGYSPDADVNELISRLKAIIEVPFQALNDVLHPDTQPSATIASMLAAPSSPLYTAMVFLLPSPPTSLDKEIILALSTHIPLIVLPRLHGPGRRLGEPSSISSQAAKLSSFKPASAVALRTGLFHSPETVALLRSEAADRFMRWREVERAVEGIRHGHQSIDVGKGKRPLLFSSDTTGTVRSRRRLAQVELERLNSVEGFSRQSESEWSKAKWEAEWMETHSRDVALRARENFARRRTSTITGPLRDSHTEKGYVRRSSSPHSDIQGHSHVPLDPLHFPSLVMFSISLLGPLRMRVQDSLRAILRSLAEGRVQLALVSGFCLGLGAGVLGKSVTP
ncbi:hypothetical protein CPC08DRAFT_817699 [Agrocybe pediades]|nr:hypothetical protein CPC08DRAFT_817699 [Agrocybe pediades]